MQMAELPALQHTFCCGLQLSSRLLRREGGLLGWVGWAQWHWRFRSVADLARAAVSLQSVDAGPDEAAGTACLCLHTSRRDSQSLRVKLV